MAICYYCCSCRRCFILLCLFFLRDAASGVMRAICIRKTRHRRTQCKEARRAAARRAKTPEAGERRCLKSGAARAGCAQCAIRLFYAPDVIVPDVFTSPEAQHVYAFIFARYATARDAVAVDVHRHVAHALRTSSPDAPSSFSDDAPESAFFFFFFIALHFISRDF